MSLLLAFLSLKSMWRTIKEESQSQPQASTHNAHTYVWDTQHICYHTTNTYAQRRREEEEVEEEEESFSGWAEWHMADPRTQEEEAH